MYLEQLSLTDFRSYAQVELSLEPGVTVLVGSNGIGKTNLMEAIGYLATLSSHRVSSDAPLLRFGTERAMIRAKLVRGEQSTVLELEINSSRANRARINRSNPVRARDILGICQTVLFAPEDLALVKGDPSSRRRFLDELLVSLIPRHAATRSDYDRVLKQRNALLKSARAGKFSDAGMRPPWMSGTSTWPGPEPSCCMRGLNWWNGSAPTSTAPTRNSPTGPRKRVPSTVPRCRAPLEDDGAVPAAASGRGSAPDWHRPCPETLPGRPRTSGCSPSTSSPNATSRPSPRHGARNWNAGSPSSARTATSWNSSSATAPAKGYASHGETWSMCLSLRLASYYVMLDDARTGGSAPILILDDVFAELDVQRRRKLAAIVSGAEQVLVTAAVEDDIPAELAGRRVKVVPGGIDEREDR